MQVSISRYSLSCSSSSSAPGSSQINEAMEDRKRDSKSRHQNIIFSRVGSAVDARQEHSTSAVNYSIKWMLAKRKSRVGGKLGEYTSLGMLYAAPKGMVFYSMGYSLWWPIQGGSARKGCLFQASGIWKGSLSSSEVYKREAKSVISVGKNSHKGWQMHFLAVKKSRERSGFVIYSYLKGNAFTAVKRPAKF